MMPLDKATAEKKANTIRAEFKSNILKWILSLSINNELPHSISSEEEAL
jgi:hypothetical protein